MPAFMRSEVKDIENFPDDNSFKISTEFIRKTSPDSLSITEIKSAIDFSILNNLFSSPLLGEDIDRSWKIALGRELNVTDDAEIILDKKIDNCIALYEGKIIHQFTHQFSEVIHWVGKSRGRASYLKRTESDHGQRLNYQRYRVGFRTVGENTNSRNLISTIIPTNAFTVNSIYLSKGQDYEGSLLLFLCAVFNSFILDYLIRQKISRNINVFYVYQLPVPRLGEGDPYYSDIVGRAAKLICTTPEFDDLAAEVGLGSHANGVTDEAERAQIRAELDGMIAHLYDLTETEFTHILSTFPIVSEDTKQDALEEYRKLLPSVGDQDIIDLITEGESAQLEFKSTARWNLRESKKSKVMEEVILKTVAAFLNSDGGTLLIGVADDGTVLGLQPDYQTLKKKDRDGYELWLMNDLLLKEFGKAIAPSIAVSFGLVDGKDVCRVTVQPGPEPTYVTIKDPKSDQPVECFFIRTGNSTNKLDKPSDITNYTRNRWST